MDRRTSLFYNKNGTLHVVSEDTPPPVAAGVIIVICFLFGVGYNFIVATAIVLSKKLRSSSFHVVLLLVSVVCLFDCLTNETVALGFLLGNQAEAAWCSLSAAFFHFFLITHSSALGLLCLERALALQEHPMTTRMCLGGVLTACVFGLVFVSPLLDTSDVHLFPNRIACGAVRRNSWFPIFSFLGFILSWGVTAVTFVVGVCSIQKHLKHQKQPPVLSIVSMPNIEIPTPVSPWMDNKNKLASTVFFLHVILLVPQIISVTVELFVQPPFEPDPWIDPRTPSHQMRSVSSNEMESLFAYSRFIYNAVVPIAILSSNRDVRLQGRMVLCCTRNVISSVDTSVARKLDTTHPLHPSHLRTPVLFATPSGLYLRAPQRASPLQLHERASISAVNLSLVSTFCDLTIGSDTERTNAISGNDKTEVKEAEDSPELKRNVRFSSKVEAIPPQQSGVWSNPAVSSQSNTHVISAPLFVKGEGYVSNCEGGTYSKL